MQNRLAQETSPYLLQHAQNPVEWYAWGNEALERARSENRPIFLSVGYSSCHWCHVMAHESFENGDVAAVMNANFVNIKVDREERPDIDDIYQKACQMETGQGGWPLSVFMTPDQRPFYVGTYFPPLDSHGRPGFGSLCRQLAQAWKEKPGDIERAAAGFKDRLARPELAAAPPARLERAMLDEAAMNLYQLGDAAYGGFGSAPKFPNAANVSFLFRYAKVSGHQRFAEFGLKTLRKMARGGIFDQIGGGFHRYSTDARWLVPHFEKMLYDNALIPVNYAEAYQVTRDPFYLGVMEQTLGFVQREMASKDGGFYSAFDADSEGGEGSFYTWTKKEVEGILGDGAGLFCLYYDVTDGGNWEGKTILCNNVELSAAAFHLGVPEGAAIESLSRSAAKLLGARSKRQWPGRDDKVITSWNAMMASAFAKGYRVSGNASYLQSAKNCISFVEANMIKNGRLLRTYKGGKARIGGYLEDYAYMAEALLDTFEVHPEPRYLESATSLADTLLKRFWDEGNGGFFMTADDQEELLVRPRSDYDLSIPSGNSVAASAMARLYLLTGRQDMRDAASRAMEALAARAAENPFAFGRLLCAISSDIAGISEITLLDMGKESELSRGLRLEYAPNSILVEIQSQKQLDALSKYPFFAGKEFGGMARAYVCKDHACSLPLGDMGEVRARI